MSYEVKPGEIAIVLRPVVYEGEWTGDVSTGLIFGAEKEPEGMRAALDLAITMAASQQFLDNHPEALDLWDDYRANLLKEIFPEAWAEANAEYEEQTEREVDGNVITLKAWTKTEGSA